MHGAIRFLQVDLERITKDALGYIGADLADLYSFDHIFFFIKGEILCREMTSMSSTVCLTFTGDFSLEYSLRLLAKILPKNPEPLNQRTLADSAEKEEKVAGLNWRGLASRPHFPNKDRAIGSRPWLLLSSSLYGRSLWDVQLLGKFI